MYAALVILHTPKKQVTLLYHHLAQAQAEVNEVNSYARLKNLNYRAVLHDLQLAEERGQTLMDYVGESDLDARMLEAQGWEREAGLWNGPEGQRELTLEEALQASSAP